MLTHKRRKLKNLQIIIARRKNVVDSTILGKWLFHVFNDFYMGKCSKCSKNVYIISKLISNHEFIEYARLNKILVAMSELCSAYNCKNMLLQQRSYRYRIYLDEITRISKLFEINNINYVIIKTLSTFPRDIADIDILLNDEDDLKRANYILSKIGYKRRKIGLEQDLWSVMRNGVVVDVELHTSVAAAEYEYFPKEVLIKNARKVNGIRIPSILDDLVLTSAHSVLKDLYITLADLLNFYLTLKKNKLEPVQIVKYAENLGLATPVKLYLSVLAWLTEPTSLDSNIKLLTQIRYDLIPLRPQIYFVIYSYLENTLYKLKNKSILSTLKELASLPQGRGIDALINYLSGSKPPIKRLDE